MNFSFKDVKVGDVTNKKDRERIEKIIASLEKLPTNGLSKSKLIHEICWYFCFYKKSKLLYKFITCNCCIFQKKIIPFFNHLDEHPNVMVDIEKEEKKTEETPITTKEILRNCSTKDRIIFWVEGTDGGKNILRSCGFRKRSGYIARYGLLVNMTEKEANVKKQVRIKEEDILIPITTGYPEIKETVKDELERENEKLRKQYVEKMERIKKELEFYKTKSKQIATTPGPLLQSFLERDENQKRRIKELEEEVKKLKRKREDEDRNSEYEGEKKIRKGNYGRRGRRGRK